MADVVIIFKTGNPVPMILTQEHQKQIENSISGKVFWYGTEEEALKDNADGEVLFLWGGNETNTYKMPAAYCRSSKKLKWIYSFSAGVDALLASEIAQLPIAVTNAKGVMAKTMAVTTMGYIISFLRHFPEMHDAQIRHEWSHRFNGPPMEPEGKTLVIIGAGAIGGEVARLASALGMHVIGVKRKVCELPFYDEVYPDTKMKDVMGKGDFVLVLTPLTEETYHLIDLEKLKAMKKDAIFMNISRGKVVNEKDLITALQEGIIKGAALDCFETEPLPPDSPLWDMKNVIITPHFSAPSEKFMDRAVDVFCENLRRYERGQGLINVVK